MKDLVTMNKIISLIVSVIMFSSCAAQEKNRTSKEKITSTELNEGPKLVVGIVVDQMRYDYLTRFDTKFSEGGFKRMISEGFNCKNNHFNFVPTYTGPGHASIFTGTTPKNHGIIGNNWYDKTIKEMVYCAGDDNVDPVGTENRAGKMSPHRMQTDRKSVV